MPARHVQSTRHTARRSAQLNAIEARNRYATRGEKRDAPNRDVPCNRDYGANFGIEVALGRSLNADTKQRQQQNVASFAMRLRVQCAADPRVADLFAGGGAVRCGDAVMRWCGGAHFTQMNSV